MNNIVFYFSEWLLLIITIVVTIADLYIIIKEQKKKEKILKPAKIVLTAFCFFLIISSVWRFNLTEVPDIVGMSYDNAIQTLSFNGINYYRDEEYETGDYIVTFQSEESGTVIFKNKKIFIKAESKASSNEVNSSNEIDSSDEIDSSNGVISSGNSMGMGSIDASGNITIIQGNNNQVVNEGPAEEKEAEAKYDYSWIEDITDPQEKAEAYNNEGLKMYNQKNYEAAIELYTYAINMNNEHDIQDIDVCYDNRGLAFYGDKRYTKAIEDFTKAIELNPSRAKYYAERADVYLIMGEADKYLQDINAYTELSGILGIFEGLFGE